MNTNKALWEKGGFTRLAECMRDSAERDPSYGHPSSSQDAKATVWLRSPYALASFDEAGAQRHTLDTACAPNRRKRYTRVTHACLA
jgi:hypothetical protein